MPTQQQLTAIFDKIDADGSNKLDIEELSQALKEVDIDEKMFQQILNEADKDGDKNIDRQEFMDALGKVTKGSVFGNLAEKQANLLQVKGHGGAVHSYSTEEVEAFSDHLNHVLGKDKDCAYLMPIEPDSNELFTKNVDGVLLAKLINLIEPNTIDFRCINVPKKKTKYTLTVFKQNENLNLVINSCKSIGVIVHNIGAGDIREGARANPTLVLGLLWQLVKMHLLGSVNLKEHPELMRLLMKGEKLEDLLKLSPEKILLRWMNYHLKEAGAEKRVHNFGKDVKDSEAYTIVMNRIDPNHCDKSALNVKDKTKRAQKVLSNAKKMGCNPIVKARDIAAGNEKLNLAFAADLFNTCPGLDPIAEKEKAELCGLFDDMSGDSREERQFRLWCNCLGIPDFYLNNLFEDFSDGLNLLKVENAVEPGIVQWHKVEKKPTNKFKKVLNNNYAVVLGKSLKFSLVGIGGSDVVDKNKKLILSIMWQLMKYHTIKFVSSLSKAGIGEVDEKKILSWCNEQVTTTYNGKVPEITKFNDKSLKTGIYLCHLAGSIDPEVIDFSLITEGNSEEEQLLNARYAISLARKLECCVFTLPEDIQEVRPKMILTFLAAVMSRVLKGPAEVPDVEFEEKEPEKESN